MTDLLTSKQVQDLLKIDRTTVYRMLGDGRLNGIKIGNQWRFERQEIERMLTAAGSDAISRSSLNNILPLQCIQSIQHVFASIAEVGAITTGMDGQPLNEISNCSKFCSLILNSPSGRQACIASWRRLASQDERDSNYVDCHAGLKYARGWIIVDREPIAMIISGQFYTADPDPGEESLRLRQLAAQHKLDLQLLSEAAGSISVLDKRKEEQIGVWMKEVAETFGQIGRDRAEMVQRLRAIAQLSTIEEIM